MEREVYQDFECTKGCGGVFCGGDLEYIYGEKGTQGYITCYNCGERLTVIIRNDGTVDLWRDDTMICNKAGLEEAKSLILEKAKTLEHAGKLTVELDKNNPVNAIIASLLNKDAEICSVAEVVLVDLDRSVRFEQLVNSQTEEEFRAEVAKEFSVEKSYAVLEVGEAEIEEYEGSERIFLTGGIWFVVDWENNYICQFYRTDDNTIFRYKFTMDDYRIELLKKLGYDRG